MLSAACPPADALPRNTGPAVASADQAPWSVYIDVRNGTRRKWCSGSIVAPDAVLTAGHCVFDGANRTDAIPASAFTVYAGVAVLSQAAQYGQRRFATAVDVYPGYRPGHSGNDVALLRLTEPFDVSGPNVRPVAVQHEEVAAGAAGTLYGWGYTDQEANQDGRLHGVGMQVDNDRDCAAGLASTLCADPIDGAVCGGDSGAGLVVPGTTPALVAVESFGGSYCGDASVRTTEGMTDMTGPGPQAWLAGADDVPIAPTAVDSPTPSTSYQVVAGDQPGQVRVGATFTCNPPAFDYADQVITEVVDRDSRPQAVVDGPSHVVQTSDIGRHFGCRVTATGPGGTTSTIDQPGLPLEVLPAAATTFGWSVSATNNITISSIQPAFRRQVSRLEFISPSGQVIGSAPVNDGAVPIATSGLATSVCLTAPQAGPFAAARECLPLTPRGASTTPAAVSGPAAGQSTQPELVLAVRLSGHRDFVGSRRGGSLRLRLSRPAVVQSTTTRLGPPTRCRTAAARAADRAPRRYQRTRASAGPVAAWDVALPAHAGRYRVVIRATATGLAPKSRTLRVDLC